MDPFKTQEPRRIIIRSPNGDNKFSGTETSKPTKMLDDEALHFLLNARKENWTLRRMAEALNQIGYTKKDGTDLQIITISNFLCKRGYRKKGDQQNPPKQIGKNSPTIKKESKFISDISEILSSNLNERMMERIIKHLITSES